MEMRACVSVRHRYGSGFGKISTSPAACGTTLQPISKRRRHFRKKFFAGKTKIPSGSVEWALAWTSTSEPHLISYANAIATPEGGTHVTGLRDALRKGIRAYGEIAGKKRIRDITSEDILSSVSVVLSVFIERPEFAGQTKERLGNEEVHRQVESVIRDQFENWLGQDPTMAEGILEHLLETAAERLRQRAERETRRKTATSRLRLPGKLADCSNTQGDTEIFLVEGDSAGGSAKQARNRHFQAVLPLRGKILNVASASAEKLHANQELRDLCQALGTSMGKDFKLEDLRYEKVIIMTDADVDGAHIATLLMTFFFNRMPALIEEGHLYLALPPLYRLAHGDKIFYARDDQHRNTLLETEFCNHQNTVVISRFKGLGEMMPVQLRDTTMDPAKRQIIQIKAKRQLSMTPEEIKLRKQNKIPSTEEVIESLMGRKPELRYQYICDNARFANTINA